MLKDLKENLKYISEIVGMISIMGTLLAIITATIYDFGFFSYFSIYMWDLPISITEMLKDTVVVFPKIFLTFILTLFCLYVFSIPLYCGVLILRKVRKIKYKIITKLKKENLEEKSDIKEEKKEKNGYKELFPIWFLLLILVPFYIFGIKNNFFIVNPFWLFSLFVALFISKYNNNNLQYPFYKWIIGIFIFYLINLFCIGIYDANQEVYIQKYNKNSIVLKDGEEFDNIKILRVYDKGMFITKFKDDLPNLYSHDSKSYFTEKIQDFELSFIYLTDTDRYYMQNKSMNIIKRNFLIDIDIFSSIDIRQFLKETWWLHLLLLFIILIIL